jgi:hypothetical protein
MGYRVIQANRGNFYYGQIHVLQPLCPCNLIIINTYM